MARKYLLGLWMVLLVLVLLFADVVFVALVTTVLSGIYWATRRNVVTGETVRWEPNVADVVSTAVDGLASPLGAVVVLLVVVQALLLLKPVHRTELERRAREDPELTDRVRRLAKVADVTTPEVRVVEASVPNSFLVRRWGGPTVCVTEPLRERLSERELDAVLAHELAHVKNSDVVVTYLATNAQFALGRTIRLSGWGFALGMAGLFVLNVLGWIVGVLPLAPLADLPGVGVLSLALGAVGILSLATASVGFLFLVTMVPLALAVDPVARRFAWAREYAADRGAVEIVGSPAALVSALEALSDSPGAPERDLREAWDDVMQFCVVPVGEVEDVDGDGRDGADAGEPEPVLKLWPRFGTHPPVEDRIERIRAVTGAGAEGN